MKKFIIGILSIVAIVMLALLTACGLQPGKATQSLSPPTDYPWIMVDARITKEAGFTNDAESFPKMLCPLVGGCLTDQDPLVVPYYKLAATIDSNIPLDKVEYGNPALPKTWYNPIPVVGFEKKGWGYLSGVFNNYWLPSDFAPSLDYTFFDPVVEIGKTVIEGKIFYGNMCTKTCSATDKVVISITSGAKIYKVTLDQSNNFQFKGNAIVMENLLLKPENKPVADPLSYWTNPCACTFKVPAAPASKTGKSTVATKTTIVPTVTSGTEAPALTITYSLNDKKYIVKGPAVCKS